MNLCSMEFLEEALQVDDSQVDGPQVDNSQAGAPQVDDPLVDH